MLLTDISCSVDSIVELRLNWDACRPAWYWFLLEAVLLRSNSRRTPPLWLLAATHPLPRVLVFPVKSRLVRSEDGNGRVRILFDPLQGLPQLGQEGGRGDLRARMK